VQTPGRMHAWRDWTYRPTGLVLYKIPLNHPEAKPLRKCCSPALQHVFSSRLAYFNPHRLPYVLPDNACMSCKMFSACFQRQIWIWKLGLACGLSLLTYTASLLALARNQGHRNLFPNDWHMPH